MCRYCKFTDVDERNGERSNGLKSIGKIREGHYVLELYINRYQDNNGRVLNQLILDSAVDMSLGLFTVAEKCFDIKYCPFCGEKL
jgi:hypothetical protein